MEQNIRPTAQAASFSPLDPAFQADPYPFYRTLYGRPPLLIQIPDGRTLALVGNYADAVQVLREHSAFSSEKVIFSRDSTESSQWAKAPTMLESDPPDHDRLRRLVSGDFTPRRIEALRPRISQIIAALLDASARRGALDVMEDVANVLPVMVIAEMLGIPPNLHTQFKAWSNAIVLAHSRLPGTPPPPPAVVAREELSAYLDGQIKDRRAHPGTDLISALVAAHDHSEALNAAELLRFLILLLIAGNETTTNLIGNGMLALGRYPEELARLRCQPELLPSAVEEMLRFDGPVQSTMRRVVRPACVGGAELAPDTWVMVILAAANRDPAQFPDPKGFDIARAPNDHIAFGAGIHYCLGAALARLEGRLAIGAMVERFPRLRLADPRGQPPYKASFSLRGLRSLHMAID